MSNERKPLQAEGLQHDPPAAVMNQHNSPPSSESLGSTASSLLERVRSQNSDAWVQLVTLYGPVVWGWAGRWGIPHHDRDDLVQEVFQSVSRGIAAFRKEQPNDSFRGWLWTIARNKMRDRLRRAERDIPGLGGSNARSLFEQIPEELSESISGLPGLDGKAALVNRALEIIRSRFERSTWEAFWRTTIDQHDPQQVATELGISVGAVYQAKSRVLRHLRQDLGGLLEL